MFEKRYPSEAEMAFPVVTFDVQGETLAALQEAADEKADLFFGRDGDVIQVRLASAHEYHDYKGVELVKCDPPLFTANVFASRSKAAVEFAVASFLSA